MDVGGFSGPLQGTLEESYWAGSNSVSSWSRMTARLMFIHYAIMLSLTDRVLGGHFDVSNASVATGPDLD